MTASPERGAGAEAGRSDRLRQVALVAVALGAAGAIALTLRMGHRNSSGVLIAMFVVWVMSPFAMLAVADMFATSWSPVSRTALYWTMLAVVLANLAVYAVVVFGPPRPKPAFTFLVVPPVSWLSIAIVLWIARRLSLRRS